MAIYVYLQTVMSRVVKRYIFSRQQELTSANEGMNYSMMKSIVKILDVYAENQTSVMWIYITHLLIDSQQTVLLKVEIVIARPIWFSFVHPPKCFI